MEFQKIMNFLDNIPNQPSKFKTKNWFEMYDKSRGTYNKDLKLQCECQVNAIIAMHICLLKKP